MEEKPGVNIPQGFLLGNYQWLADIPFLISNLCNVMINPDRKKILILFAHPAFEKSRVNLHLAEAVKDLEGVYFHDLYQEYPDFHFDIDREQELLLQHDIIIFHHPFFWYSTPAILKEWQDLGP